MNNDGDVWQTLLGEREANELFQVARDFHDCLVARAVWESAEFINTANEIELLGFGSVLLSVDSQFTSVPATELRFRSVRSLRYDYEQDSDAAVNFVQAGVIAQILGWEIHAGAVDYRFRDRRTR